MEPERCGFSSLAACWILGVFVFLLTPQANQELEALEEEMLQMQESTHLFEVALPEYKQMKQCRKEIKLLKGLWDVIIYVRVRHCLLKACMFFFLLVFLLYKYAIFSAYIIL